MSSISLDDIYAAYNKLPKGRYTTEIHCSPALVREMEEMAAPQKPDRFGNHLVAGIRVVAVNFLPRDVVVTIDQFGEILNVLIIKNNEPSSNG